MIGKTLSHYKILEKLGEGGMGVVYKAKDLKLNRFVALKFLPQYYTKDESSRKRFMVEAQATSALDHPNICNIHEINETNDGQLYISMAYYEGESLRQKIKKRPILLDEALNIIFQIAQGLSAAHAQGIVHRDVKPANVIITDKGEVKIVDFGLAKLDGGKLTQSLSTKGTIAYMSPSAIRDYPIDHREDIWAIGILLFEMLTGQLPFEGSYAEPMMYSIVNEKPKMLSEYLDNVPEKLKEIIEKLLQKEKEDSYKDISELLIDLQPLFNESITIEVKTQPTIIKYLPHKKPYLYMGAVVLIILLFLTLGEPLLFPDIIKGNKIAVLPLNNISNEIDEDWLTEGMTDALITELAQISGLSVISRNSSMQYKGTTKLLPDIAKELGVYYLIDGSLLRMGESVKISARLINTKNNNYIWAKEYNRDFKDILGLQGEIAKTIAAQIEIKLTPQEETLLTKQRKINPETYEMYMKGMYYINKRTPNEIEKGISYLQQAVEKDSTEPLAQAGLSLGYCILAHTPAMLTEASRRSKLAAMRALELDENLAEAHLAIAMNSIYFDWNRVKAETEYKRALEINPNLTLALMHYAWFQLLMENNSKAQELMIKALEIDPLSNTYPAEFGWMKIKFNDFDNTIKLASESIELDSNNPFAYFVLGEGYSGNRMYDKAIEMHKKSSQLSPYWEWGLAKSYALAGNKNEAMKIITKLERRDKLWDTWCIAVIYSVIGNRDKMFYWLDEALDRRHPYIQWVKTQRYFDSYSKDSRFIALMKKMNLPD